MVMTLATSFRSSGRDRLSWGVRARAAARRLAALWSPTSAANRGSRAFMGRTRITRRGGLLPPDPTGSPVRPLPLPSDRRWSTQAGRSPRAGAGADLVAGDKAVATPGAFRRDLTRAGHPDATMRSG